MSYPQPQRHRKSEAGIQATESLIILFLFCILLICFVSLLLPQVMTEFKKRFSNQEVSQPATTPEAISNQPAPKAAEKQSESNPLSGLADKAIILALVTGLIGGIAWSYKQILVTLNRRAKVMILEFLSDNNPHSREEIKKALKIRRYGPMYLDALSELVEDGKVSVKDKMYSVPKPGENKIILT